MDPNQKRNAQSNTARTIQNPKKKSAPGDGGAPLAGGASARTPLHGHMRHQKAAWVCWDGARRKDPALLRELLLLVENGLRS